jgi:hypothetical protein
LPTTCGRGHQISASISLTGDDTQCVHDAHSPELVHHLERNANQQLKYKIGKNMLDATKHTQLTQIYVVKLELRCIALNSRKSCIK